MDIATAMNLSSCTRKIPCDIDGSEVYFPCLKFWFDIYSVLQIKLGQAEKVGRVIHNLELCAVHTVYYTVGKDDIEHFRL